MIYLYLFGTCFHFIYVFMIIGKNNRVFKYISTVHVTFYLECSHFIYDSFHIGDFIGQCLYVLCRENNMYLRLIAARYCLFGSICEIRSSR